MKSVCGADKKNAGFWSKFMAGTLAGAIGSLAGNPFDVLKTRMMANDGVESPWIDYFASDVM